MDNNTENSSKYSENSSPQELLRALKEKEIQLQEMEINIKELEINLKAKDIVLEHCSSLLLQMARQTFGRKSEKSRKLALDLKAAIESMPDDIKEQMKLKGFDAMLTTLKSEEKVEDEKVDKPAPVSGTKKERKPKAPHAPTSIANRKVDEEKSYEPIKVCSCGGTCEKIGVDKKRVMDYIKIIKIIDFFLPRTRCRKCNKIYQPKPPNTLKNVAATTNTIAQIIVDHCSGTPENRTANELNIPRQTLTNWLHKGATITAPIADLIRKHLNNLKVIHIDETRMPIINLDKGTSKSSYLVTLVSGKHEPQKISAYTVTTSRARDALMEIPRQNKNDLFMMTDAYSGYCSEGKIRNGHCLAHARRRFVNVIKGKPQVSQNNFAQQVINLFSAIYKVEDDAKDFTVKERFEYRLKHTIPILNELNLLLTDNVDKFPHSALGESINYTLNNWDQLTLFLEMGNAPVDNNIAENAIRPFVVSRKNSLFSNNLETAQNVANLYTIVQTAKINDLDVKAYISYILPLLEDYKETDNTEDLLPWNESIKEKFGKKG